MANIHKLVVNTNGVNHTMPSLPDSPPMYVQNQLDIKFGVNGINGDDSDAIKCTISDDRIKRRSKRPSKAIVGSDPGVPFLSGQLVTNGYYMANGHDSDLVSPKTNGTNGLKKFTKNSRQSRGRGGRGLPPCVSSSSLPSDHNFIPLDGNRMSDQTTQGFRAAVNQSSHSSLGGTTPTTRGLPKKAMGSQLPQHSSNHFQHTSDNIGRKSDPAHKFAGSRFTEAPNPSLLPKPPKHWMSAQKQ